MDGRRVILAVEPLTAPGFAPFGEVIEAREDAPFHEINRGFAKRFNGLATIDTAAAAGTTAVAIVRALPRALPFNVVMLERHLLVREFENANSCRNSTHQESEFDT